MSDCGAVRRALRDAGLLLMQDKSVQSVVGIMAGAPLRSSWWSHPRSHEIFRCLSALDDNPDVLVCRLIGGKVTYVAKWLWPPFLALATSREKWQTAGLSAAARGLLKRVEAAGAARATGDAAREPQERLLVAAEEVHTESGRHEIVLQTWDAWMAARNITPDGLPDPARAREALECAVEAIGARAEALPWNRFAGARAGPRSTRRS